MRKISLFGLILFLCSCAPAGYVVYDKTQGKWQAKEIVLYLDSINDSTIRTGADRINSHASESAKQKEKEK